MFVILGTKQLRFYGWRHDPFLVPGPLWFLWHYHERRRSGSQTIVSDSLLTFLALCSYHSGPLTRYLQHLKRMDATSRQNSGRQSAKSCCSQFSPFLNQVKICPVSTPRRIWASGCKQLWFKRFVTSSIYILIISTFWNNHWPSYWTYCVFAYVKVCVWSLNFMRRFVNFVENDTLARLGTSCLQQLLERNFEKLGATRWERITTCFVKLFRTTTPHQLFDESLRVEIDNSSEPSELSTGIWSIA